MSPRIQRRIQKCLARWMFHKFGNNKVNTNFLRAKKEIVFRIFVGEAHHAAMLSGDEGRDYQKCCRLFARKQ